MDISQAQWIVRVVDPTRRSPAGPHYLQGKATIAVDNQLGCAGTSKLIAYKTTRLENNLEGYCVIDQGTDLATGGIWCRKAFPHREPRC